MNPRKSANSIILTDWGADCESLGQSPEAVLYELLLLSLLYDNILIQDEVFALSNRMARWFLKDDYREMLTKCFELGTVVVLSHPLAAYPTDDLKELSQKTPILARAEYIQKFGTRGQDVFNPNQHQLAFYQMIDSFLLNHSKAQRPVGSLKNVDIMATFASILKDLLCSPRYSKWLKTAFRGITDDMKKDFLHFIEQPESVIERLKSANREYKALIGQDATPVFNRSLAFQATSLYPPQQAKAMQRLVQTTFAAPFSWREDAAGRYSRSLRELLWMPSGFASEVEESAHVDNIVSVEAHVDTSVGLPDLRTDFVEAITSARNSESGKKLRTAVRRVGSEASFHTQKIAWIEMANELAGAVTKRKRIDIRTALIKLGKEMFLGSVASGVLSSATGEPIAIPTVLAHAFLTGSLGLLFGHGYEVLRCDLEHQEIRWKLEQAVEFRCTSVAMPPVVQTNPATSRSVC